MPSGGGEAPKSWEFGITSGYIWLLKDLAKEIWSKIHEVFSLYLRIHDSSVKGHPDLPQAEKGWGDCTGSGFKTSIAYYVKFQQMFKENRISCQCHPVFWGVSSWKIMEPRFTEFYSTGSFQSSCPMAAGSKCSQSKAPLLTICHALISAKGSFTLATRCTTWYFMLQNIFPPRVLLASHRESKTADHQFGWNGEKWNTDSSWKLCLRTGWTCLTFSWAMVTSI